MTELANRAIAWLYRRQALFFLTTAAVILTCTIGGC